MPEWDMDRATCAAESCMRELLPQLLGRPSCELVDATSSIPHAAAGVVLTLRDVGTSLDVFVIADPGAMVALTRGMLQFGEGEDDPGEDDVADAVGEVVNVLGGLIKEELSAPEDPATMGLPAVMRDEHVPAPGAGQVRSLHFDLGGIPLTVGLVLRAAP